MADCTGIMVLLSTVLICGTPIEVMYIVSILLCRIAEAVCG